jgi:hypothetical protein
VRAVGQGKWPEHLADGPAVRLTEANAGTVSLTLLSIDSYVRAMRACPFSPEVAFRFQADGETVTAFVSFDCSTVLFEDGSGRPLSGRLSLGRGRRPLLAVAKAALPENRKVQALPE